MSEHKYTNHLINEKSQYLLQHAHNPVDWYPWGEEAFAASRIEDKPIFLSIGYATCHWCHVMAEEVFENEELAQHMNEAFINVKLDREELPEVDALYMELAQSMIPGSAGWPLNVVLTPDLHPIFAATYIPVTGRPGVMGMEEVIAHVMRMWKGEDRERVQTQARMVVEAIGAAAQVTPSRLPKADAVEHTTDMIYKLTDPIWGGMQGSPKFPLSFHNELLLRHWRHSEDSRSLFCVEKALNMMARGGIYDHIGGGFARYAVDEMWRVPHFEKMLYDNALLASTYLHTWRVTRDDRYRRICQNTLNYVRREMLSPEGGFYSAQDADSEQIEGKYYTWTPDEVVSILGKTDGILFCDLYGVSAEGNHEGRSVLHLEHDLRDFARTHALDPDELEARSVNWRSQLFEARELRVPPATDDKVLTSWNGLMIGAFAQAGAAFREHEYIDIALRAAKFIEEKLWNGEYLLHRWRDGEARFRASLDDYAFLTHGLLCLYEATGITHWLKWAIQLADMVYRDFSMEDGGFYQTDGSDPHLLLRRMQFTDGAEPSGSGVHAENLLRLYTLTWNESYKTQAEGSLRAVAGQLETYPVGFCYHLLALQRCHYPDTCLAIVAFNQNEEFKEELMAAFHYNFLPHVSVVWRHMGDQELQACVPHSKVYLPVDGQTTLYVCRDAVCDQPVTGLTEMISKIQQL